MEEDFGKIMSYLKDNDQVEVTGKGFSIYHKWDMVKKKVSYTAGVPVSKVPTNLPADIISGAIPSAKTYKLRHTGSYKHLGNAWSTMYNMVQNKEIKPVKGFHPFELYINTPEDTKEEELVTDIYFAVK